MELSMRADKFTAGKEAIVFNQIGFQENTEIHYSSKESTDLFHIALLVILTTSPDGNSVYKTWDEETRQTINGQTYFGLYFTGGIDKLAYVWVLPSSMEFVRYSANVKGDWVLRGNALAFFAEDVNNVAFEFELQRKLDNAFKDLSANLADREVEVRQDEDGITLTVLGTILFASGSAEVTPAGAALLNQIVSTIGASREFRISVEGHTDNTQITGALARRFPTNWELSSARSLSVLRALASEGVDEGLMEARAFGEHRPRSSNDTAEGRAENRRIEIRLLDK
ncbi:OmpA/MotB family protein [Roseibium sp.]|uniref:OmpA/MotB family protein n=1 Tax=Roseibium sp. TaxID=1936156 RepID=UPI003B5014DA